MKRDVVMWTAAVEALLGVWVIFNLPGVTQNTSAAIMVLVTAAATLIQAGFSSETSLAALLGVARAGILLAAAYGWNVSEGQIEALVAAVAAIAGMFLRTQGSPLPAATFRSSYTKAA